MFFFVVVFLCVFLTRLSYVSEKIKLLKYMCVVLALIPTSNTPGVAGGGGGVLPYMGDIGMCCREGYGFQAVYSRIGYILKSECLGLE